MAGARTGRGRRGQRPRAWSAPGHAAYLTGHAFLPALIAAPFSRGLDIAFDFAIAACLVAALASLLRGRRYVREVMADGGRIAYAADPTLATFQVVTG